MEKYKYESKKKNIIWIFADQLRYDAIGYNGDKNVRTPNIDRLAIEGVNFENAISGFPLCCPFRGSLITSEYADKCVRGHEFELDPSRKTIAHTFNENGYDTVYIGKWHLDGVNELEVNSTLHVVPKNRRGGFKKWIGYDNNNSQYNTHVAGNIFGEEIKMKLDGYETDALTNIFIEYLEKNKDNEEPFFGVLSVQPPHDPHVAPPEFMGKYKQDDIKLRDNVPPYEDVRNDARQTLAGYYAQIENFDYNIGKIIEKLNDLDIYGNTHIMVFSDHGDMHGSHGMIRKTNPYNEAIKIPLIISGELAIPYNRYGRLTFDTDALVDVVDIAPTTLGLCNIETPVWMKGYDMSGYRLEEKKRPKVREYAYLQNVVPTMHPDSIDRAYRGIITKDGYKYLSFEESPYLMFDLNKDPLELTNLTYNPRHKDLKVKLHDILLKAIVEKEDEFKINYEV